jgi:hypothetical protein
MSAPTSHSATLKSYDRQLGYIRFQRQLRNEDFIMAIIDTLARKTILFAIVAFDAMLLLNFMVPRH